MIHRIVACGLFVLLIVGTGVVAAEDQVQPPSGKPTDEVSASPEDQEASTPEGAARVTNRLAEKFHVETQVITDLRDQHLGFGEIDHALTLANQLPGGATQENINQIMTMRQDQHLGWGQIAHEVGTTLGAAKHTPIPETSPATEAQSLPRPGSTPGSQGQNKQKGFWGWGGTSADRGIERSGNGLGRGGGMGKSSSAPGHNR